MHFDSWSVQSSLTDSKHIDFIHRQNYRAHSERHSYFVRDYERGEWPVQQNHSRKLKPTVFPFYSSWYRVNFEGRNCSIFPGKPFRFSLIDSMQEYWRRAGSAIVYWWMCLNVNWAHYKILGQRSVADQPVSTSRWDWNPTVRYSMIAFIT